VFRISRSATSALCVFLILACLALLPLTASAADRQIVSGPYSLSVRGGSENNSAALGFDGRVDYLTRLVNLHLLGTFDLLEPTRGLGEIDQQRYGAALALSHTFPAKANIYAGTAFVNQMGENFGHAYLGGKLKVADFALLSAAYGFGFGNVKQISKASSLVGAEAVDWLEAGVVLASSQGLKLNAYYTLTDPGDLNFSGVAGEISYPIYDDLTLGVRGNADLNPDTGYWRNWSLFGFLTLAMGNQKGSPIDVALEKNNPLKLPVVLNKNIQQASASTITFNIRRCGDGCSNPVQGTTIFVFGVGNIFEATDVTGGSGSYTYAWSLAPGSIYKFGSATDGAQVLIDQFGSGLGQTLTCTVRDASNPSNAATLSVVLSTAD